MRFLIAGLIVALTLPATAAAKTSRGQCKDRCSGQYQFCLNRAHTKQARKLCKADRSGCKSRCPGR